MSGKIYAFLRLNGLLMSRSTMSGFNLTLENANMQVIKIDAGNEIVPSDWVSSVGILYPGERMDILTSGDRAASLTIALDPEYALLIHPASHTKQPSGISNS